MSIGRNIGSANTLLRSYAARPGLGAAAGAYLGKSSATTSAGRPLNRFLQNQKSLNEDIDRVPQNTPMVMSYDRPRMPPPSPSSQGGMNSPYRTSQAPRMTTNMDYRPFSEPASRQLNYSEEEY